MKNLYRLLICCFIIGACWACDDEDKLTSRFEFKLGDFEFPQGDNEWDERIMALYEKYNVRVIYKDITEEDLARGWVGGGSSSTTLEMLTGTDPVTGRDSVAMGVDFLEEQFFPYVGQELGSKLFPIYLYLGRNVVIPGWILNLPYSISGMDNWIISISYSKMPAYGLPAIATKTIDMAQMIEEIYNLAIKKGAMEIPQDFSEGIDFDSKLLDIGDGSNITDEMKANPNFYLNRGFIDIVNQVYLSGVTDDKNWTALGMNNSLTPPTNSSNFTYFLRAMILKPESLLREKYRGYELINRNFDVLYRYFESLGINLRNGIVKYQEDGVTAI